MDITPINWRELQKPELDVMNLLSAKIAKMEIEGRGSIPDLRRTDTIVIASDYGGQHSEATQEIYTFLIADGESIPLWDERRKKVRSGIRHDPSRTMAYKKLGDGISEYALKPFLKAANPINGLLFSVGFDRSIRYITPDAKDAKEKGMPARFKGWKRGAYERMLRVVHIVNMLLAGLTREGQDVEWLTDADQIAASPKRGDDLVHALAATASLYLPHKLGDLQCRTVSPGARNLMAEDVLAIPDLVCGALGDFVKDYRPGFLPQSTRVVVPLPGKLPQKAKPILVWHMDERQPLKRLFFEIEATDTPGVHTVYARQLVKLPRAPRSPFVLA